MNEGLKNPIEKVEVFKMEDLEEGMDDTVEVKTKGQLFAEHLKRQFAVLDDDDAVDENEPSPCKGQKIQIKEVTNDVQPKETPKEEIDDGKMVESVSLLVSADEAKGCVKESTSTEVDDRDGKEDDEGEEKKETEKRSAEKLVEASDRFLANCQTSEAIEQIGAVEEAAGESLEMKMGDEEGSSSKDEDETKEESEPTQPQIINDATVLSNEKETCDALDKEDEREKTDEQGSACKEKEITFTTSRDYKETVTSLLETGSHSEEYQDGRKWTGQVDYIRHRESALVSNIATEEFDGLFDGSSRFVDITDATDIFKIEKQPMQEEEKRKVEKREIEKREAEKKIPRIVVQDQFSNGLAEHEANMEKLDRLVELSNKVFGPEKEVKKKEEVQGVNREEVRKLCDSADKLYNQCFGIKQDENKDIRSSKKSTSSSTSTLGGWHSEKEDSHISSRKPPLRKSWLRGDNNKGSSSSEEEDDPSDIHTKRAELKKLKGELASLKKRTRKSDLKEDGSENDILAQFVNNPKAKDLDISQKIVAYWNSRMSEMDAQHKAEQEAKAKEKPKRGSKLGLRSRSPTTNSAGIGTSPSRSPCTSPSTFIPLSSKFSDTKEDTVKEVEKNEEDNSDSSCEEDRRPPPRISDLRNKKRNCYGRYTASTGPVDDPRDLDILEKGDAVDGGNMENGEMPKCLFPKRDASQFLHSLQPSVENLEREGNAAVEYFDNNFWREPLMELPPLAIDQQLAGKSGQVEIIEVKEDIKDKSIDEIVAEKVKFYLKDLDPEEEESRFFTEVEETAVERNEEPDLLQQLQKFLKEEEEGHKKKAPLTVRSCLPLSTNFNIDILEMSPIFKRCHFRRRNVWPG